MKGKLTLIIRVLLVLILIGIYYFYNSNKALRAPMVPQNNLNSDDKRQDCIEKYGTREDPLGLFDNADPRLAECLMQVDPNNPLGI